MKTVQNDQGPGQPRLVYYELDHDGRVSDILAGVMALRGYKLTSDESLLDKRGPAVLRDSSGALCVVDETRSETFPEVETFMIPQAYANALADWFDLGISGREADTAVEWQVRRSQALTSLHLLRKTLESLEAGLAADVTAFEDRSPQEWGQLVARHLASESEALMRVMTDPVDAELIESARIELAGRRAIDAIRRAGNGGS